MNCSKNGIKKEGSSCSYNNKCIYPKCINDMNNEYIIVNKTLLEKRIEELIKEANSGKTIPSVNSQMAESLIKFKEYLLSQSTPLILDIKDIQIWLSKQSYQKEYGEQEYMMYYDVDIPKIIQDYISNLKLDI